MMGKVLSAEVDVIGSRLADAQVHTAQDMRSLPL